MKLPLRNILLLVLMLATAGLAIAMRQTHKIADQGPKVNLETMIPHTFGEWHEEKQSTTQIVDPQTEEMLDKIYSQTLTRTYVNGSGYRIMLSIAYGVTQNKQSQVHRPDVCYPAQGFQIVQSRKDTIQNSGGSIKVRRLVAKNDKRIEPITYWIRVGDRLAQGWIEQKYAVVMAGVAGKVSDGLIFRISSINTDIETSFSLQDRFIEELLSASSAEDKRFLIGQSR